MDHVHHNHTYYALGSEASGTSQRPVSRDKHRGNNLLAYYGYITCGLELKLVFVIILAGSFRIEFTE
jgi:hypothetical protein